MSKLVLSTMYAQQQRFEDGGAFARYAAKSGYDAIEVSHSTDEQKLRQIVRSRALPVTSVHQPAPRKRHTDGRWNGRVNLASPDPEERAAAVAHAKESLSWAASLGASRLVVHLGQVTEVAEQFSEERELRRLFDSGRREEEQLLELHKQALNRRQVACEPYLDAARASLLELVAAASPSGIVIGLENRYHFHEIPLPGEYEFLLDGLDVGEAGYWHDTGHAEVLHRLGFVDRSAWLSALSSRCVGAHLHDVLGIGDHRAPGDGDVEWGYIVAGVKHLDSFTLEINQHQSDERVRGSIDFLKEIGLG
ncbi:MAG: sugar phosphate isomerase/epimerase family protein [Dehalococcoidia bacterium]